MRKVILTENQVKNVIDKIINEQQASEFAGSTDANSISHTLLSKNFGLPEGNTHENFYYTANVADVIKMSATTNNRSQFLSIFKPTTAYGNNPKAFTDYFDVNGEKLSGGGSKIFNFTTGIVTATHNGLLALARAMDRMGGKGGKLTITFAGKRESQGVSFDSNRALNQDAVNNLLCDMLAAIASNPSQLTISNSNFKDKTPEQIAEYAPILINRMIIGFYGFIDFSRKDEILSTLKTKEGFISQIDFNLDQIIGPLKKLQNFPDFERDSSGKYTVFNEKKKARIDEVSNANLKNLITKIKETYITNFKIYIENYLPNTKDQILPLIPKVSFKYESVGFWYNVNYHSTSIAGGTSTSNLNTSSGQYQSAH